MKHELVIEKLKYELDYNDDDYSAKYSTIVNILEPCEGNVNRLKGILKTIENIEKPNQWLKIRESLIERYILLKDI